MYHLVRRPHPSTCYQSSCDCYSPYDRITVPNLSIANDHPFLATPNAWIIELHNGADSRLSTELITGGLLPALDIVERDWRNVWRAARAAKDKTGGRGSLILVGNRSQDKFFSNGMYSDIALRCITKFNAICSPRSDWIMTT